MTLETSDMNGLALRQLDSWLIIGVGACQHRLLVQADFRPPYHFFA